ncbi:MAG: hypothetical protein ACR2RE_14700, partial [Geminicoccaceae bacterium]
VQAICFATSVEWSGCNLEISLGFDEWAAEDINAAFSFDLKAISFRPTDLETNLRTGGRACKF